MATTVTLKPNAIDLSGSTSGTTTLQATAVAGTTTITLPAATDTLVGKATTDTLTNKTLTAPTLASANITTALTLTGASGTNGQVLTSAGTGAAPTWSSPSTTSISNGTSNVTVNSSGGSITATTNGTAAVTIDTSQNVGIGTTSPSYKLDVVSTGNSLNSNLASRNTTSGTAAGAQILVGNDSTNDLLVLRALSSTYTSSGVNTANGALVRGGGAGGMTLAATDASGIINFATGGTTERMRITSAGKVGIGTTAPDSALHISGSAVTDKSDIKLTNTDSSGRSWRIGDGVGGNAGSLTFFDSTAGAGRVKIDASGYLYCPAAYGLTTGSAANCFIAGDGSFQRSTSSLKYKKNIADATHGLTDLLELRSVTYEGKADGDAGKTFGGFIAEEVDALGLTEFVQYAEDGSPDALAYGNMVALCVKSIQELKAINDTQAETITSQADAITALTARIVALEAK